jgi:hypothetical protein
MTKDFAVVLKGDAAKKFLAHDSREPTKAEIEFQRKCVEFYDSHCPKKEKTDNRTY